jgi:RNA polymerase sigma-70 factor (ECF subfamily)
MTGNAADAEDVLQQVFLRLLRRSATADPLENQESYLRRAAINLSLDIIRNRQEDRSVPIDEAPHLQSSREQNQGELRDSLRRALATLSGRAAEIFALRHFEGYKNQEIARMLDMSQVQVAVTLFRTRKQLQKEISKPAVKSGAKS